jgi:hypothetical protein
MFSIARPGTFSTQKHTIRALATPLFQLKTLLPCKTGALTWVLNYNGNAVMDGQLTYSIGVNFSTYRNKILALDPQNPSDFLTRFLTSYASRNPFHCRSSDLVILWLYHRRYPAK